MPTIQRRRHSTVGLVLTDNCSGWLRRNLRFGNLGRNVLRGFWQRRVDLSLAKTIPLGGIRNIELRWDIFNVFNTVNYALPNNVIGGPTTDFGKITDSVGGPRVMPLGARVRFR